MRQIASNYYENLLKAISFSRYDLFKQDVVWSTIQSRVFIQLSECFLKPLSHQETVKAAKTLAKDVSLGLDGLGVQWYIKYWDLIGEGLTKTYQQILDSGNMPQDWNEGLIHMIPKSSGS